MIKASTFADSSCTKVDLSDEKQFYKMVRRWKDWKDLILKDNIFVPRFLIYLRRSTDPMYLFKLHPTFQLDTAKMMEKKIEK